MSEMIFFLLWTKFVFLVLLHFKQEGTSDFHEWCRCSIKFCSYSFILLFWTFVTLWWWRDVRWVLYYFCTFVYKPVKKSLNSNSLCMHTFLFSSPEQELTPPPYKFSYIPTILTLLTLPCLPSRAQPRSPFSPFVIHLASSFHCRDKRAHCIVGRLSLKKGPLPCVCWESRFYVTPTHSKTFQHTLVFAI